MKGSVGTRAFGFICMLLNSLLFVLGATLSASGVILFQEEGDMSM